MKQPNLNLLRALQPAHIDFNADAEQVARSSPVPVLLVRGTDPLPLD